MSLIPKVNSLKAKNAIITSDPQMYRYGTNFKAEDFNKLKLRVKYSYVRPGPNALELFFDTDKAKGFCTERRIMITLETNDTGENFVDYEVDLTKVEGWQDTITDLRLDPFSSSGYMEFEYVRFVKE